MVPDANFWIQKLGLSSHIEGGSFKEIYRSELVLNQEQLPGNFRGARSISTSIYFMLQQGQFSAFHRIASDEQWHFYYGGALLVYEIHADGRLTEHRLGNDPFDKDSNFQCVINAGSWFASKPDAGVSYCLAGCTVSPGFDFEDFELAARKDLVALFPQHEELISLLSYPV